MKIKITRTTMWSFNENEKPHKDAFISKLPKWRTHVRSCKSFDEFDERFADREGKWISKGVNHRVEGQCIYREERQEGKAWYIKISSMKALNEFIKENGQCVLMMEDGELLLEIYDGYRE